MNTDKLFQAPCRRPAAIALAVLLGVLVAASALGSWTQRDFGRVDVSNVTYDNSNGIPVRAKLFRPVDAGASRPMPGIVYIHGYQNNRETSDAYCIELARRGMVVLNIDAIGRGNSGIPNDQDDPTFDPTYGGLTSMDYLRSLPYVDTDSLGMMGHSLGAEMAYTVALQDPTVRALVISGFAYTLDASAENPKNMLMIIGQWDEYRERMTGTTDIEAEWMSTSQTQQVIPVQNPQLGVTYGDFASGTARRVFVPRTIHIQESHSRAAIAEAVDWARQALQPPPDHWIDPSKQIWPIKEWATLVAMVAGFGTLLPLGLLLLQTNAFGSLRGPAMGNYACRGRDYFRAAAINGLLMWLYLPLIFMLFGLHVYVVPIDGIFPMMLTNGIVWWFLIINLIGFALFRTWYRKQSREHGLTLAELGISYRHDRFSLGGGQIGKTALLAGILFAFAYLSEHLLEQLFIVDYRFIFPFASDLTLYRAGLFLRYFPFLLVGFVLLGFFLHGRLRPPKRRTWLRTYVSWSLSNTLVLVIPLVLFLLVQYVPLLTTGVIPFVGPGGMLANFTMSLMHVIGVLMLVIPISTWFYQLTGKVYLGAFLSAALVTWMYVSSQVVAPIPV